MFVVCFCITITEIIVTGRHHVKGHVEGLVKIPNGLGQCFSLRSAYVGTVHARQVQAYVSALLVLIPTATNGCILRRTSREWYEQSTEDCKILDSFRLRLFPDAPIPAVSGSLSGK